MIRWRPAALALVCGTLLSILPRSAAAADLPSLDLKISSTTRLLVVSPHPDDEALAAAGLIARVLESGGAVRLVVMTSGDAFAEGVETEEGIKHPTLADYRDYGKVREYETVAAAGIIGLDRAHITFLGFPDDGLCRLASKYLSVKSSYSSPYTKRSRPPTAEQIVRGVRYDGFDVRRELERIIEEFEPTVVLAPHPEDEHPDHCSTQIFVREALDAVRHAVRPRVVHYLIHYRQWPLTGDAGHGSQLSPPDNWPTAEGTWVTLPLTHAESTLKKRALLAYSSQMLVIGRFVLAFGRDNELFLVGEPASMPECWCDGQNVATELPPGRLRKKPKRP